MQQKVPESAEGAEAMVTSWRVRTYGEGLGDYQMVSGWKEARGLGILLENTLPPTGIIVEKDGEPVAASWLFLCYEIGVAFWEGLIAKPGISLGDARAACGHCVGALKAIAQANQTSVIKAYTTEALAHEALKHGFKPLGSPVFPIATVI